MRAPTYNIIVSTSTQPLIAQAVDFTEVYRRCRDEHPAVREAMCLKTQYPAILTDIRKGDFFAGRKQDHWLAYTGTIAWGTFPAEADGAQVMGKQGGYCFNFGAVEKFALTGEDARQITELEAFWHSELSLAKIKRLWDDNMRASLGDAAQVGAGSVGFGLALDIERLLRRGIPGLLEDIEQARSAWKGEETAFFDALRIAVGVLIEVCSHYERQARSAAGRDIEGSGRYEEIADALAAIVMHPPRTLRQAIQLTWLYTLLACKNHIEAPRLDVALGDYYAHDIDSGLLTEEEALELILGLWRLFNESGDMAVCRIVIGGIGRPNEGNADRFALAAMEATRRFCKVTPQLTLRFYRGQNPALMKKAFAVLGEGCIFPMLYNDDVVVPGVAKALGVSEELARRYHPLGCGEYMIAGCSPSLLDVSWSIPKSLEAVLHNGRDCRGVRVGPETGKLESLDTYEKLYSGFLEQIRFSAKLSADAYACICEGYSKECSFLFASLLTDDCLARGKGLLAGGVRLKGACVMGHGFTNAADALTGIRRLVYEEKRLTLRELVTALDANFEGHETVRRWLLDAPKFGNDQDEADTTLVEMWRSINEAAKQAGALAGLDFHIVSSVNPGGYGTGTHCGATADGRKKGESFAIGHAPTAGFDKSGLTALFNSVVKVDPANGGAATNFKIAREFFTAENSPIESLFGVYFAKGGIQASLTVVNRDDLEAALQEPEKYSHVLVRLGGWAARFVELEPMVQREILERTLY